MMIRIRSLYVLFATLLIASHGAFAQSSGSGDAVELSGAGKINWTAGEVYATGIGAPPSQVTSMAQARAMAERAAVVVAYRNLLEIVKGVRVDSETVVQDFMVKSDSIRTRVDGIVRGARILKTQYLSDGSVEVLVAMSLKGALMDSLVPETFGRPGGSQPSVKSTQPLPRPSDVKQTQQPSKPTEPQKQEPVRPPVSKQNVPEKKPEPVKPSPPPTPAVTEKKQEPSKPSEPARPVATSEGEVTIAFKGGTATGLVIDGRGLGLKPALLPRIVDTQGQEIYVGQVVTRTNAVEQGVAGYAKDVNAASNNFRVTDNPAVIKGLRASGSARTDIVVGQADAQMLRQLGSRGDFLQYCRVIIVY